MEESNENEQEEIQETYDQNQDLKISFNFGDGLPEQVDSIKDMQQDNFEKVDIVQDKIEATVVPEIAPANPNSIANKQQIIQK